MEDETFCKSGESGKAGQSYVFNVAEFLPDLCSSSCASKVEKLISTFRQTQFELKMFREYGSSVADYNRITNDA